MDYDATDRAMIVRVSTLLVANTARIEGVGVEPEMVCKGAMAAALIVARAHVGEAGLVLWLRECADEIELRIGECAPGLAH